MYDPEFSLKMERSLSKDKVLLNDLRDRLGEDHPWTQRVGLVTDILQALANRENDLSNCFDESKRLDIEKEIDDLVSIAREALK